MKVVVLDPVPSLDWIKQFGGLGQFKLRGTENVCAVLGIHVIAYNLVRLGNLLNGELEAA